MGVVFMGWVAVQTGCSQLPIWMREASWIEGQSWRFESWSGGESLRLHHARLLKGQGLMGADWLQIGRYAAAGFNAGHTMPLAPQLSLQVRAGFRLHRWRSATAVRRRFQPEIHALVRADLDAYNRLFFAFRFSPHGPLPSAQARDEMSIQGDWVMERGAYAARATVNWSNRGTALQWRLMHQFEGQGAVGLHWMLLSGFLGIEWQVNRPHAQWSVSVLGSAQLHGAAIETEWHW